jgi:hypothetical protein
MAHCYIMEWEGVHLECIIVLSNPVINVNRKLQVNADRVTNGPVPSIMKIWITSIHKEP